MFGWFRKPAVKYGRDYQHVTKREDWDQLTRDLFFQVIDKWQHNALALVTNHHSGARLSNPYIQVRRDLEPAVEQAIKRFDMARMKELYARAAKQKPPVSDCYQVRNVGLPNNALVYLIEHQDGDRRVMLVFGGARLKGELERWLAKVSQIVTAKTSSEGSAAPAAKPAAAPANETEPAAFPNKQAIRGAGADALEAREAFLHARKERLDYKRRIELHGIQSELERRAKV